MTGPVPEHDDDGDPARGLAVGVWLSLAFWAVAAALGFGVWAWVRSGAWPWGGA